ncbi:hypothetical protein ACFFNY_13170 [Paenibacillus hodogayensis]|uniref:SbsA Ig-like domain-containing protein n=1 Tax=Paenibacillus hodogayensis TaxID=279208 RepID=A0ABV5VWJ3_9BACL
MKWWICLGAAVLMLAAAGCESGKEASSEEAVNRPSASQLQPSQEPASPAKTPETGHADVPQGGSGETTVRNVEPERKRPSVAMTFEGDARLKAPATTLVPPTPQSFRIAFGQPMDRESVALAIVQANASMRGQEQVDGAGKFVFDWQSDTELRVQLQLTADDFVEDMNRIYAVNVSGAKTKQGETMPDDSGYRLVVTAPDQLWRVSADGSKTERLAAFGVPYGIHLLDEGARFVLLTRPTQYCECDARSVPLYSVYDAAARSVIDYPVPLFTRYVGTGDIAVDRRGFLFADTGAPNVPAGKDVTHIRLDGYVQGAEFTKDRSAIIAAVGKDARQTADLDLVWIDLASGAQRRWDKALIGSMEGDMVSDGVMPVAFYDDGKRVYTRMFDANHQEIRYSYDRAEDRIGTWNAPQEAAIWSGFVASEDGTYRMYANGGLYKGDEKRAGVPDGMSGYPVQWLGTTHSFAYKAYEQAESSDVQHLYVYDADSGRTRTILSGVSPYSELIGASADGKWLYMQTRHDLKPD